MAKSAKGNVDKTQKATSEPAPQQDAQVEFEQRFGFFMTGFRTACEEAKAPVAIAIVVDPKNPSTPFVYNHGHIYDQAVILSKVLRDLRRQINEEIST